MTGLTESVGLGPWGSLKVGSLLAHSGGSEVPKKKDERKEEREEKRKEKRKERTVVFQNWNVMLVW